MDVDKDMHFTWLTRILDLPECVLQWFSKSRLARAGYFLPQSGHWWVISLSSACTTRLQARASVIYANFLLAFPSVQFQRFSTFYRTIPIIEGNLLQTIHSISRILPVPYCCGLRTKSGTTNIARKRFLAQKLKIFEKKILYILKKSRIHRHYGQVFY